MQLLLCLFEKCCHIYTYILYYEHGWIIAFVPLCKSLWIKPSTKCMNVKFINNFRNIQCQVYILNKIIFELALNRLEDTSVISWLFNAHLFCNPAVAPVERILRARVNEVQCCVLSAHHSCHHFSWMLCLQARLWPPLPSSGLFKSCFILKI